MDKLVRNGGLAIVAIALQNHKRSSSRILTKKDVSCEMIRCVQNLHT